MRGEAKILAIVVSFNPSLKALEQCCLALNKQVEAVLVVDNASENSNHLRQWSERCCEGLKLIQNDDNLGLGAAYNQGIDYAEKNGFDYVLLLDQDSIPAKDMAANLLRAHSSKSAHAGVSAVGARYQVYRSEGSRSEGSRSEGSRSEADAFFVRFGYIKFRRFGCDAADQHSCVEADFLISSGSLISLESVRAIGKMDESLFIDHVDTEWFLRARARGFSAYGVCDATMRHGLGEKTHHVRLPILSSRSRHVPQHKPFRYYYIFRNSLSLYKVREYSWCWKWNDLQRLVQIAIMYSVFVGPRWQNLKMMLKGCIHALQGKKGRLVSVN